MTKVRRIFKIIGAVLLIHIALFLMLIPQIALQLIAVMFSVILIFYGLKFILFYITHASHMVNGKWFILLGLLLFDIGVFASLMQNQSKLLTIAYIAGAHLVGAILRLIRAVGNKKDNNPGWIIDCMQSIGNFIQVAVCIIFSQYVEVPVFIYCSGLIYSAILSIIQACKRTAIVYVQ